MIICGDSLTELKKLKSESVDACVTDPPYGLAFMGKDWDSFRATRQTKSQVVTYLGAGMRSQTHEELKNFQLWCIEWAKEVLRVLKPGGHLLSFGGSRTYHRMACAIEDAGFEIRDQIMWVYGSGFPKSLNIGKAVDKMQGNKREVVGKEKGAGSTGDNQVGNQTFVAKNQYEDGTHDITKGNSSWEGYGTALKPAHEPIVLARKPLSEKTIAENVLKWGVGGLAIDNCRVEHNEPEWHTKRNPRTEDITFSKKTCGFNSEKTTLASASPKGRFPANFIHDGSDEVTGLFPQTKSSPVGFKGVAWKHGGNTKDEKTKLDWQREFKDSGSAARFFYCAKASKSERDRGCEELEEKLYGQSGGSQSALAKGKMEYQGDDASCGLNTIKKYRNYHPTVKPLALMRYLITLITREGQIILDPFMGSGTTGIAAKQLKREFIGIELNPEYVKIAEKRILGILL